MAELIGTAAYVKNRATLQTDADADLPAVIDTSGLRSQRAARRAWELLDTPQTVKSLARAIAREEQLEADDCAAEIAAFMERLAEHDLIEVSPDT